MTTQTGLAGAQNQITRVLFREDEIFARLDSLAREIEAAYAAMTGEITVVALLNGSLIFAADLIRRLALSTRLESLAVESYHGTRKSCGVVSFRQEVPELPGRHVLVLDDILDTGRTLGAVLQRVVQSGPPASVRSCVLLRKRRERDVAVEADFVGFDIDDLFVVGYGLDFEGRMRNLPFIGVLADPVEKMG